MASRAVAVAVAVAGAAAWASVAPAQDGDPRAAASERASEQAWERAWEQHRSMTRASPFKRLRWRTVGPRFAGGRIESIAVAPDDPYTIYVAPGAGNLWKTEDGGMTWTPVFEHQSTFAIGDVAVAPSDADVVWVGTGEAHLSGTSYPGTGVFRSTDGGASWTNVGLRDVRHIGKVRVHPNDADTAWVAAIGPMRGASDTRGVFKTTDAGASFRRTLDAGARVAAIDLALAPDDPDRLYAATWDRGQGDGSGVHRSTDGGETWERLTKGLPVGAQIGRVAVAVSRSAPRVVYALTVDASKPGDGRYGVGGVVYRSDDGGDTWRRCRDGFLPTYVGWDFCDVRVAPDDPDQVFVCGRQLIRSSDAGATWTRAGDTIRRLLPHPGRVLHLDMHDLWIDPERPDRMLLGTDGGLYQSFDRGDSWLHLNNLPIAEFYTVAVDDDEPYRIWGGTQDNASLFGPALAIDDGGPDPWRHVFLDRWAGGDGFATLRDPTDAGVVYFSQQNGDLKRKRLDGPLQNGNGEVRIRPRGRELRFAWNTPLCVSHHAPRTLYTAAQFVFRSTDRGDSWQRISEDLGGGRGIVSLSESAVERGLLYAGAARGRVHRTADDGATWHEAADLPRRALRRVVASRHDAAVVYAALSGRPEGDRAAYLFASTDRGATWRPIAAGLPAEPVNVLVEDPRSADVLYVGTDLGVFVSLDRGASWESLCANLPTTPVVDLAVQARELDLCAATHGRGVFVLDVAAVLREKR